MINKAGIGSFFNSIDPEILKDLQEELPLARSQYYYTGRHALRSIFDHLIVHECAKTIWLPRYYCQHVTAWLVHIYSNIQFYAVDPFSKDPKIQTHTFGPGDVILFNNFYGLSDSHSREDFNGAVLVEDHSHGWLSQQAVHSQADYCIASLRKTLPVPMGGIAWIPESSPRQLPAPPELKDTEFYKHWDLAVAAMEEKSLYIIGELQDKSYLQHYQIPENYLHQQYEVVQVMKPHLAIIDAFVHKDYAAYKKQNLLILITQIEHNQHFKILYEPECFTFGLQLLFRERDAFVALKTHLIEHQIYPSELWPDNDMNQEFKYLMNLHLDFRYNRQDMQHIIQVINSWKFS